MATYSSDSPSCSECGRPFSWADETANDALRPGALSGGLCRSCRRVFFSKALKEKKHERN